MQYSLRTFLIWVAVWLTLLEFGLFMLPESKDPPGEIGGWLLCLALYIIPLALILTLAGATFAHFSDAKSRRVKLN